MGAQALAIMRMTFNPNRADGSSYYAELRVSDTATTKDIQAAFRCRARVAHPDKGGSSESFQRLQIASHLLLNCTERGKYNEWLWDVLHQRILAFEPGHLGIRLEGNTVSAVTRGSQCDRRDVRVGWKVVRLDQEQFLEFQQLQGKVAGLDSYTITFDARAGEFAESPDHREAHAGQDHGDDPF